MPNDRIGKKIKTINNLMKRTMDRFFGHAPDRNTLMHSWIMGFIERNEVEGKDVFQKDIEVAFSINRSTTSEMMKLMCKKGMIERIPVDHDKRLKKIVLTDQSREFLKTLSQKQNEVDKILMKDLTKEEVETFASLCDKIINNLNDYLEKGDKG